MTRVYFRIAISLGVVLSLACLWMIERGRVTASAVTLVPASADLSIEVDGMPNPVLAGEVCWAAPEFLQLPAAARVMRLTSVEWMLRRGRTALRHRGGFTRTFRETRNAEAIGRAEALAEFTQTHPDAAPPLIAAHSLAG